MAKGTLAIKWSPTPAAFRDLHAAAALHEIHPSFNAIVSPFLTATGIRQLTLAADTDIKVVNATVHKVFRSGSSDVVITVDDSFLDTGTIQAGKDYYVYVCDNEDGTCTILGSLASTYPAGYTADSSRKISGFHTLCVSVGTVSGHPLTGYVAGDILPQSVWCLNHRSEGQQEGHVYDPSAHFWCGIYLPSGTGSTTASVYGGTITDTRTYFEHVDDLAAVGDTLLDENIFQSVSAGSNEETNITGSADPVTTGGHVDTAGRRMISNIGVEDCCGAKWQWTSTPSARLDDGTAGIYVDLPGGKGSFYTYGTNGYGNTRLLAGGAWNNGTNCGSRSRNANNYPWGAGSNVAGRGCARSRRT